uniref:Uncharacterized protein n=1 Tax=Aegilops tauschii TaxID=37682 RepID=R7W508_AEGTA
MGRSPVTRRKAGVRLPGRIHGGPWAERRYEVREKERTAIIVHGAMQLELRKLSAWNVDRGTILNLLIAEAHRKIESVVGKENVGSDVMGTTGRLKGPHSPSYWTKNKIVMLLGRHCNYTAKQEMIASQTGLFDHLINVLKFKRGPLMQPVTYYFLIYGL